MPIILPANTITGGYEVDNSLRFDDGSSDYLTKSFGSAGSLTTWTLSYWIKRSNLSSSQSTFSSEVDANNSDVMYFQSSDKFDWWEYTSGYNARKVTNMVFRDTSAWYHIVCVWDTTNATSSDRQRIYVNGERITSFSSNTEPSLNETSRFNSTTAFEIGRSSTGSAGYLSSYMAEVCFIDGQALDATSFGEFDTDSGIWKPIDVSGLTFGTNGFYLDFENSGSLGADVSGNGNNFTVNNLTSIDQTTDTPTNNYATMNPLDNYYANSTFSEGNLKYTQGSSRYAWNLSTIAVSSGKWYSEVKLTTSGSFAVIGVTDRSPLQNVNDILGSGAYDYSIHQLNGDVYNNAGTNPPNTDQSYASSYASGDIIGIALDLDNNKIYWSKNGSWSNGSGSWNQSSPNGFISITAPASTNNGQYFFASGDYQSAASPTFEWNFGNAPFTISSGNSDGNNFGNFEYAVPSGYYALCTKNLAEYG